MDLKHHERSAANHFELELVHAPAVRAHADLKNVSADVELVVQMHCLVQC